MKKVVLTGGPCGGKSTVIERMRAEFGNKVAIVPEVATSLLETGFPPPNPWTQKWQNAFQIAIICSQYKAESQVVISAPEAEIMICDRGTLDGAAYLAGGVAEFCQRFRLDKDEELSRYERVIHLESLSTLNPNLYLDLMKTNPNRFEPLNQAQEREINLRQAWGDHPRRFHLAEALEESANKVSEIVSSLL